MSEQDRDERGGEPVDPEDTPPTTEGEAPAPERGPTEDEGDGDFPSLDELIGTFFTETALLPVVVVVLGTGGAFGAALMILTVVDRNYFAAAALVLLAGMTVDVSLRARKEAAYRNVALLIGMVWGASVLLAGVAVWTGIAF